MGQWSHHCWCGTDCQLRTGSQSGTSDSTIRLGLLAQAALTVAIMGVAQTVVMMAATAVAMLAAPMEVWTVGPQAGLLAEAVTDLAR